MRAAPLLAALGVLLAARTAAAFPELALRADAPRCTACHVGPAGGGLINDYGRMEAADTLSRGGDGALLFGLAPPGWLTLGGDLRAAGIVREDFAATEGVQLAAFPMQLDLRAAASLGDFTIVVAGGLKGSARRYDRSATNYLASAEHYAMWRKASDGLYLRAGRFAPVAGLRLPDHTLFVRRFTGQNLYEEPYGVGAGWADDRWELHGSAFVHDPVLDVGRREAGAALHVERHLERWHLSGSARAGLGDDGLRTVVGAAARGLLGDDAVVLAEADWIHLRSSGDEATAGTAQLAALAGLDYRLAQGVQLFGWVEEFQSAALVTDASRTAAGVALKYYPWAHWEVIAHNRWLLTGTDDASVLGMLQVHYYF